MSAKKTKAPPVPVDSLNPGLQMVVRAFWALVGSDPSLSNPARYRYKDVSIDGQKIGDWEIVVRRIR